MLLVSGCVTAVSSGEVKRETVAAAVLQDSRHPRVTVAGDLYLSNGRVHVTLNALSAPRRTRALAAICEQLNDTETCYPGTDLVMHYTIKPHPGIT